MKMINKRRYQGIPIPAHKNGMLIIKHKIVRMKEYLLFKNNFFSIITSFIFLLYHGFKLQLLSFCFLVTIDVKWRHYEI